MIRRFLPVAKLAASLLLLLLQCKQAGNRLDTCMVLLLAKWQHKPENMRQSRRLWAAFVSPSGDVSYERLRENSKKLPFSEINTFARSY